MSTTGAKAQLIPNALPSEQAIFPRRYAYTGSFAAAHAICFPYAVPLVAAPSPPASKFDGIRSGIFVCSCA